MTAKNLKKWKKVMGYVSFRQRPPLFADVLKVVGDADPISVMRASMRYILREENFNTEFDGIVEFSRMPEVRSMLCKFDFAVRLKIAFLACRRADANFQRAVQIFNRVGLHRNDVWIWMNTRSIDSPKSDAWLVEGNRIPTPDKLRQEAYDLIYSGSVKRVIHGVVRSKLWFIASSQPVSLDDLEAEVSMNALESFFLTAPFLVEKHKKPSIVRSAQNYISKIISHYTYAKRARMVNDGGTFVHTTVSLDEKSNFSGSSEDSSLDRYWFAALDTQTATQRLVFDGFETVKAVQGRCECVKSKAAIEIFASCDSTPIRSKLVNDFLKAQSEKLGYQFQSVIEIFDDIGPSRFFSAVRRFIGFSMTKWNAFMDWFRDMCSGKLVPV